jgi:hypothetical protein
MWRRLAWGTKGREPPISKGREQLAVPYSAREAGATLAVVRGGNTNDPVIAGATDYASLQSTCPSTSSGESGNFISSRRLCRTRLHRPRFRFALSPDEKSRFIVRRIIGGPLASRFSRSHFQRCQSQEHGRRHVGGVRKFAFSRRRIARFGVAGKVRQEVVVKVGRQTRPGPSS